MWSTFNSNFIKKNRPSTKNSGIKEKVHSPYGTGEEPKQSDSSYWTLYWGGFDNRLKDYQKKPKQTMPLN